MLALVTNVQAKNSSSSVDSISLECNTHLICGTYVSLFLYFVAVLQKITQVNVRVTEDQ